MTDKHYTSKELAEALVGFLPPHFKPDNVADFAAGEGSLLDASQSKWPDIEVIANDISLPTVRLLRRSHPTWTVSNVDFLSLKSIRASALAKFKGGVDLVVINPPFSQRSASAKAVKVGGESSLASIAIAFTCESLDFLAPGGYLLAVLPDGCLINERDRGAWEALRDRYRIEILRDNARSAFRGVRARTSLVRFSLINDACKVVRLQSTTPPDEPLQLVRGTCQMHTVGGIQHKRGKPLVHTSHLRDGKVDCSGVKVKHGLWINGPAVLFPRVGRATPDKIAILTQGMSVVLSDCVFALQCTTNRDARMSRDRILKSWANFAECYRGTGAPHITAARAGAALASIARIATSIPWTTTAGTSAPEHQRA